MSEFKDKIFKAVAAIPEGKVATYSIVAQMAGYSSGAARAVGNAIHQNTDPVSVPCHRVVGADGTMGRNYVLGGPERQRERLKKEGVTFREDDTVDMEKCCILL